jgi:hypothetical protein
MKRPLDLLLQYARAGQLGTRLRKFATRHLYVPASIDPDDTVILAGSNRSGTTWLSELINFDNRYRFIFEPIQPEVVPILGHFRPKQYIRPGDTDPRFLQPIDAIIRGQLRNSFVDKHNMRLFARAALIKMIRGHLLLYWLHEQYPSIPKVLILRHPCAVLASKRRLDWHWGNEEIDIFLDQEDLVEDHLLPFIDKIRSADSEIEQQMMSWCIENFVLLKQFKEARLHVVFYEHLCADPSNVLPSLFDFVGRPFDGRVMRKAKQASATSNKDRVHDPKQNLSSWTRELDDWEIQKCVDILCLFGLDSLYSDRPDPIPNSSLVFGPV